VFVYVYYLCDFCVTGSLDRFILVLLAYVVLGLAPSVLSQKFAWEERFRNCLFCVEWDVNLNSINQSTDDLIVLEVKGQGHRRSLRSNLVNTVNYLSSLDETAVNN